MKRLLILLVAAAAGWTANAAQIWTVNSVADPADPLPLIWLNANTINTNVFAAYGTAWGDNAGGLWTFKKGDATATNTVALGGPVESVNPVSPAGRWFKLIPISSSAPAGGIINPTDLYIPYRINTNSFGDSPFYLPSAASTNVALNGRLIWGPGTTNMLYRSVGNLVYAHTNLSLGTFFDITGDGTNFAKYGQIGAIAKIIGPSGIYLQGDSLTANYVVVLGTDLRPSPTTSLSLGSTGGLWDSFYLTNHIYTYGNVIAYTSAGPTNYFDLRYPTQTNDVTQALAFSYATNGITGAQGTVERIFVNGSGSDQTVTWPAGWRTNFAAPLPPAFTNQTITTVLLSIVGDTSTAAKQTNAHVLGVAYTK